MGTKGSSVLGRRDFVLVPAVLLFIFASSLTLFLSVFVFFHSFVPMHERLGTSSIFPIVKLNGACIFQDTK